jgi:nitrate reductase gamma subunit
VVGLGELTHVIAGAVEVLYLPFRDQARFVDVVTKYLVRRWRETWSGASP